MDMKRKIIIGTMISILAIILFFSFFSDYKDGADQQVEVDNPTSSIFLPFNKEAGTNRLTDTLDTTGSTAENSSDVNSYMKPQAKDLLVTFENNVNMSFQRSYDEKVYKNNKRSTRGNMISVIKGGGSSYRLMEFSRGIGALLAMYEATGSASYIEEAMDLTEQVIAKSKKGKEIENNPLEFKDDYLGWANINPNNRASGGSHLQEVPLFESYLFRYLAKMVYLIDRSETLSENSSLRKKSRDILEFINVNGWEKWFTRGERKSKGCYPYLFRSRTHMTAHWAVVALYLHELTDAVQQKAQYEKFLAVFDEQLKGNLHITKNEAYIWNMTWDHAWPLGTACNKPAAKVAVQDVSHGNHVVTYIVEAFELNRAAWKKQDIDHLINTAKYLVYNTKEKMFNADLSGKIESNMSNGILTSDGFVKLTRYSNELMAIFKNVRDSRYTDDDFNFYEAQYVAELILAAKYHAISK